MEPRFQESAELLLIGKRIRMSLTVNRTYELWKDFMPERARVPNQVGRELYSAEVYPSGFFISFDPGAEFEKWAAVHVNSPEEVPEGMESLVIPAGLYAVFIHRGPASEGPVTYRYIFENWLPASGFNLDDRPHFALMGEKYRKDSPDSEEEIWIPVRPR
jgi:AraC family transcriptional regulator